MISVKIEGINTLIDKIKDFNKLPFGALDNAVKKAANPLAEIIRSNYEQSHMKTGALANSIDIFKRRRKGSDDPYHTYYVGPRYTSAKGLISYGGNAAHLLEYGTVNRFVSNTKAGGMGKKDGLSKNYGSTLNRGKIERPTIGVVRRSYDGYKAQGAKTISVEVTKVILRRAKTLGL